MTWFPRIFYLLGCWLLVFASIQFIPLLSAWVMEDYRLVGSFGFSIFINGLVGACLYFAFMGAKRSKSLRLMIFLPLIAYCATAVGAALPFVFYYAETPTALTIFEGMSILTTTGSSALREGIVEAFPLVLWRALASWAGGFGYLVIALTFFMRVNVGGMQLYPSDFAKGNKGAAMGSITAVTGVLLKPYIIFTCLAFIIFAIAGENVDSQANARAGVSLIRALALVSTTGMAVPGDLNTVVSSVPLQIAYMILMTAAMINLDVLYGFWQGAKSNARVKSIEFKLMPRIMIWGLGGLILLDFLVSSDTNYMDHYFMLVSSMSTMGLSLEWWPVDGPMELSSSILLMAFVIIGGGILTTTGGIGLLRLIILVQQSRAEVSRLIQPSGIHKIKFGRRDIKQSDMDSVWLLVSGFFMVFIIGSVLLGLSGHGVEDSIAMTLSSLTTSGGMAQIISPEFAGFAGLTSFDYVLLTCLMLYGRLGVTLLLILGAKAFWSR